MLPGDERRQPVRANEALISTRVADQPDAENGHMTGRERSKVIGNNGYRRPTAGVQPNREAVSHTRTPFIRRT